MSFSSGLCLLQRKNLRTAFEGKAYTNHSTTLKSSGLAQESQTRFWLKQEVIESHSVRAIISMAPELMFNAYLQAVFRKQMENWESGRGLCHSAVRTGPVPLPSRHQSDTVYPRYAFLPFWKKSMKDIFLCQKERELPLDKKSSIGRSLVRLSWQCFCRLLADLQAFTPHIYDGWRRQPK